MQAQEEKQKQAPQPQEESEENEFTRILEEAHLPSTLDEQVVYRTPSEKDTIILVCGDQIHYVGKGEYGGWILKDTSVDVSKCRAYLARPKVVYDTTNSSEISEALEILKQKYSDLDEITSDVKKAGGYESELQVVNYDYIEVKAKEKKRTDHYVVLDLEPMPTPRRFTATAIRLGYFFPGSRRHVTLPVARDLLDRLRLAYNIANYMYAEPAGYKERSATIWLKLIVNAPPLTSPTAGTTAVVPSAPGAQEQVGREGKAEVKATLSELKSLLSELAGAPATTAPTPATATAAATAVTEVARREEAKPTEEAHGEARREAAEQEQAEALATTITTVPPGMTAVRLLLFTLPSEYRATRTEVNVSGNVVVETRKMNADVASKIRALRVKFYDYLSRIAYRFHDVWALYSDVTEKDLRKLIEITDEIEDVLKNAGIDAYAEVVVVPALIPRDYLANYLNRYIENVRKEISEEKNERRRRELMQTLEALMRELKSITGSIASTPPTPAPAPTPQVA